MKALSGRIIGLYSLLCVCGCSAVMNSHAVAGEAKMEVFRYCLSTLGGRLDCYFTVESVGRSSSLNNPILDAMVSVDTAGIHDVEGLIAFLTNEVRIVWIDEGVTNDIRLVTERIERDKTIIRIRDARLLDVAGYSLTNRVSMEYVGHPEGLLIDLSSQNSLIQRQKAWGIGGGPLLVDFDSHVDIAVTNMAVRDLLTHCIPLEGYNRVIWSSYTDGNAESPLVTVRFHGLRWAGH